MLSNVEKANEIFDPSDLENSGLEKHLYNLFPQNPLNNILHNVITNFLINLNSNNLKAPFNRVKMLFSKNEDFFRLISTKIFPFIIIILNNFH